MKSSAPHAREALDEAELRFFERLQTLVRVPPVPVPSNLERICGVDAAYRDREVIAAAVLSIRGRITKTFCSRGRFTFPYVSGLFYLHEGPFAVAAIEGLRARAQLLCFDAHGEAHPRSAGLATTAGMMLGIPSIGIAKSLAVGTRQRTNAEGLAKIIYRGRQVGFATGSGRAPRFWSPGYSVTLADLKKIIRRHHESCLRCLSEAHRVARARLSAES